MKLSGFDASEDFFLDGRAAENIKMILANHFEGPEEFRADGVLSLKGDNSFVS